MSYTTQSLHRLVQRAPDALAAVGARRRSWSQVETDVRRWAGALVASGLRPGDRVAFLARNTDRHLDYILGAFWAGGVLCPVNTRWSASEIAFSLADCEARILIIEAEFAEMAHAVRSMSPGLTVIVQIGGDIRDGTIDHESWLAAGGLVEDLRCGGADLAAVLYTGGTTGRPKGVMLSHGNLLASANGYLAFPGARPGAVYLHVAPLFHVGGLSGLFTALLAGSTHVFLPAFDPLDLLTTIRDEDVTDVFLVPTMLRAMLVELGRDVRPAPRLERIIYGASTIEDVLLDRAMAALPGVAFVQAYGMTELSPIATLLGPEDHSEDARREGRGRSAGRATTACEVRIVDDHGRETPRGRLGEIAVRGAGVMQGYWGLADETAAAVRDGWMHTGDVGVMDRAGYVTIVDRLKDMIVTGGENVYSAEVENALSSHPSVHQCAVIGLTDAIWGEAVHAVVVLKPGEHGDMDSLRAHCRSLIASYKTPKTFEFVDALPLSPAGKVLKIELRRQRAQPAASPPGPLPVRAIQHQLREQT